MKVVFLVNGDESKRVVEECARASAVEVAVDVRPFGDGLCVVDAGVSDEGVEGARALSEFRGSVEKELGCKNDGLRTIRILVDDASALFSRLLYPMLCEFEVRLRAALIVAMCSDKGNFDGRLLDLLEKSDLGQLDGLLFKNRFIDEVSHLLKNKELGKQELLSSIDDLSEEPLWAVLFGDEELGAVRKNFSLIRGRRNDVMHFHIMTYKTYLNASKVLSEANDELKEYVTGSLDDNACSASKKANAQAASRQLAGDYAAMLGAMVGAAHVNDCVTENMAQIQGAARALKQYSEVGNAARESLNRALAAYDLSGITSALSQVRPDEPISPLSRLNLGETFGVLSSIGATTDLVSEGLASKVDKVVGMAAVPAVPPDATLDNGPSEGMESEA